MLRGSDISANMQEFKIFSSLIWKHCIALANEVIFGVSTYSICFVQWLFSLDSHNTRSAMKIKLPEQLNIGYEIKCVHKPTGRDHCCFLYYLYICYVVKSLFVVQIRLKFYD